MATVTSISESLTAIGARMDKEKDILFLFLSSHGSREHELALNQNNMSLRGLSAKDLAALLKETRIRWKVVVVSACYGGGFIDPIKDDPAISCDPGSPVRFWINVNEPFEIKREEGRVVVDHRFMDSRRIVHLGAAAPADAPRSAMGYSTGAFEGDALVITTDHFVAGAIEPRRAVPHTENLKLTERLEVTSDGELEITMSRGSRFLRAAVHIKNCSCAALGSVPYELRA